MILFLASTEGRTMRILHVAGWMHPDAEGGSFRLVYEVARRQAARGHEVHVVTSRVAASSPAEQLLDGVHVHRYPTSAQSGAGLYASTLRRVPPLITRLHAEVGFDGMLLHHPIAAFAANRARALRRVPRATMLYVPYFLEYADRHTYEARSGREGEREKKAEAAPQERRPPLPLSLLPALPLRRRLAARVLRWLDGRNLRRSERIVVLSDFSRRLVDEHYPDCLDKVVQFPAGADLERFRPEPSRADARARLGLAGLGLPDGPPLLFTCRRLEHRMGVVELVEAVRRLRDEDRRVVLLIGGRGALADALAQQVRDAGLEDSVRLLGFVAEGDLPVYYRAADCFVIPTRALEGFGLVTAEAFACGTPVLGTPVGATPEIIRPFDPRLVADAATPDALARAIRRFLDELAPDDTLSARCRAYAEQHFSWDALADGLLDLFEEIGHDGTTEEDGTTDEHR
jgi:glycosyltransferase involved in cell wall biosynthesis